MGLKLTERLTGDGKFDRLTVPVQSATVIGKGDLISYESGYAVPLDLAAEDATFLGASEDQSAVGETLDIVVLTKVIGSVPVESAAYTIGQALAYNASNTTLESSTANTIAWSMEDTSGVSKTSLKVLIDTVILGKLFLNNA